MCSGCFTQRKIYSKIKQNEKKDEEMEKDEE